MRAPTVEDQPRRALRSLFRRVFRGLRVLVLLALLPLVVYLWPISLGGRSTIVFVSGESMLPTITTDDVVVARAADSYSIGDVVVAVIPQGAAGEGGRIIHRIVGGSSTDGWVTQGDNRSSPDQWVFTDDDIMGRADVIAPFGDEVRLLFRPLLWPLLWAVVGAISVFRFTWRRLGTAGGEGAEVSAHSEPASGPRGD